MNGYINGASTDPLVKTITADKSNNITTSGTSHHFFSCRRNSRNSLKSCHIETVMVNRFSAGVKEKMLKHPATHENLRHLESRGVTLIPPQQEGMLACGYEGPGKLATVDTILRTVEDFFAKPA